MYDHHLRDMVVRLIEAGVVGLDTAPAAKQALASYWEGKVARVWDDEEVQLSAEQLGLGELTGEHVEYVLDEILDSGYLTEVVYDLMKVLIKQYDEPAVELDI